MKRRVSRMTRLATLGSLVALSLPLLTATPALAAVSFSFTAGTMTITGTAAGETITVTCTTGTLQAGSDSGTPCVDVKHLIVKGLAGNDLVSLAEVIVPNFPSMKGCKVVGAGGDDDIQTSAFDDTVLGGKGADIVRPFAGHDVFDGGKGGYDEIYSTGGHDQTLTNTSYAGLGRAVLKGIERGSINGGDKDDRIDTTGWTKPAFLNVSGGEGADVLVGGPRPEFMYGEDGADRLKGGGGNDFFSPDAGAVPLNDKVLGGPGRDELLGTEYNGGTLSNTQITVAGTDTLGSIEQVVVSPYFGFAGPSDLDASAFDGDVSLQGTSMGDTFTGGSGDDRFTSLNGADTYVGHGGTDEISVLLAGAGSVNVSASAVASTSAGAKSITGVEHVDVYADSASQTFGSSAFGGSVTFQGGGGDDLVNGNGAGTSFVLSNAGTPVVVSDTGITTGSDTVGFTNVEGALSIGLSGAGSIDASAYHGRAKLYGSNGLDDITGTPHADRILTYGGADTLTGLGGDDIMWGLKGPDTFSGGGGFDRCDDTATEVATSCEGDSGPPPT